MTSANLVPRAGNRNRTRHGLTAGQLPKGAAYVKRCTDQLRAGLESAVAERNGGEVSLYHAALIQSAIRWERHALLAQRWLRQEAATLNADQRLAYSREVARASAERDKCLKLLALDVSAFDHQLRALYSDPWPTAEPPAATEEASATSETSSAADAPEGFSVAQDQSCPDYQSTPDNQDTRIPQDERGTEP